jgi:hypothetical protein
MYSLGVPVLLPSFIPVRLQQLRRTTKRPTTHRFRRSEEEAHVSIRVDLSTLIPLSGGSLAPPSSTAALASSWTAEVEFSDRNAPRPVYFEGTVKKGRAGSVAMERDVGSVVERIAEVMGIRLKEVRKADIAGLCVFWRDEFWVCVICRYS